MQMTDIIDGIENYNVLNALLKARQVIPRYLKVAVSISGGSDSDIMLDIVERVKGNTEVVYYFIDTGIEYQATKDHLDYLEERYGIKIERVKAEKSIPTAIREKGVPFLSKLVSDYIHSGQLSGFDFSSDESFESYEIQYKNTYFLKWWCNTNGSQKFDSTMFNVAYIKWLKCYLQDNPPSFPISAFCCRAAKKATAHKFVDNINADLDCVGIRKAEGGIRSAQYKSCWDEGRQNGIDVFRPIFWLTDEDKRYYEALFGIKHSRCYWLWGFKRTGCVGCPFHRNIEHDLEVIKQFEPRVYKACMNIFGKSYEYTKKFRSFQAEMRAREKAGDQLMLTELAERME